MDIQTNRYQTITLHTGNSGALAALKNGESIQVQCVYRFYIYHSVFPNTCNSVEYTRATTITYQDPTLTATDFTPLPTTSTYDGTVTVASSKSSLNGASYAWSSTGPFSREYNGPNAILLRPTAAYDAVTNKDATVTEHLAVAGTFHPISGFGQHDRTVQNQCDSHC